VTYEIEPAGNAVRLTFDRAIESAPNPKGNLLAQSSRPHRVFEEFLVLELKFTDRYPQWLRELVEHFNCIQGGAAKYAEGIFTKGEDWVHRAHQPQVPEALVEEFLRGPTAEPLAQTRCPTAHTRCFRGFPPSFVAVLRRMDPRC